jgi:hypothetical protein
MTHVNFITSGAALTDTQVARIREEIENTRFRSAWDNGVKLYALDIADIAKRLCSPSEMKRKTSRSGMIMPPTRIETWIQVQGRALNQAWRLLRGAALTVYKA